MHTYTYTYIQAKQSYIFKKKRASKGGQQEKATATNPEDLTLILGTHTVEGEN